MKNGWLIFLLGCLLIAVSACKHEIDEKKTFDIFDHDQISERVTGDNKLQQVALQKYEQGVKKLRKEKDATAAIEAFVASIKSYPKPNTYFELGNAYASSKQYDYAIACYEIAEQMGFAPVSKLFYNMACAYSLLEKMPAAQEHLELAVQAGYLNKAQIAGDSDLVNLRKRGMLWENLEEELAGVENPDMVVWEAFNQAFSSVVLPLTLDLQSGRSLVEDKYLSYTYERYISEMHEREVFSRGTGRTYYAVAAVERNDNFLAVVYAETNHPDMGELLPARYYMASYDMKGKLIEKVLIGGQRSLEDSFRVCTIYPNLTMELRHFINTYKLVAANDYGEGELELAQSVPASVKYYSITESGKVIETGPPMGSAEVK